MAQNFTKGKLRLRILLVKQTALTLIIKLTSTATISFLTMRLLYGLVRFNEVLHASNPNKAGTVRINVTLRRVRVTTLAVEKQSLLHIQSVCL